MTLAQNLGAIIAQEKGLVFSSFDENIAWKIGCMLHERAVAETLSLAIDIRFFDRQLFFAATHGVVADNHDWVRRKARTVQRFLCSSYRVAHELALEETNIEQRYFLSPVEYAACGGGFPITIRNVGVIGSVVVSGLPDRRDHELVVDALCDALGKARADFLLPT